MIQRGNDFQNKVDFKVTIKMGMQLKKTRKGPNAPDTLPVFWGDMTRTYPPHVKIVRIFTSSTFTGEMYNYIKGYN